MKISEVCQSADVKSSTLKYYIREGLVPEGVHLVSGTTGLPAELLRPGWPGEKARDYFEQEAARLLPAATTATRRVVGMLRVCTGGVTDLADPVQKPWSHPLTSPP